MPLDPDLDIPTFLQRADAVAPKAKPVPIDPAIVAMNGNGVNAKPAPAPAIPGLPIAPISPTAQKISDESHELIDSSMPAPGADVLSGAGMIFLRRSGEHRHWVVQFTGLKQVQCDAVLDVPVPCNATLRDVLAWLGATYNGKLGGAWLLVAP